MCWLHAHVYWFAFTRLRLRTVTVWIRALFTHRRAHTAAYCYACRWFYHHHTRSRCRFTFWILLPRLLRTLHCRLPDCGCYLVTDFTVLPCRFGSHSPVVWLPVTVRCCAVVRLVTLPFVWFVARLRLLQFLPAHRGYRLRYHGSAGYVRFTTFGSTLPLPLVTLRGSYHAVRYGSFTAGLLRLVTRFCHTYATFAFVTVCYWFATRTARLRSFYPFAHYAYAFTPVRLPLTHCGWLLLRLFCVYHRPHCWLPLRYTRSYRVAAVWLPLYGYVTRLYLLLRGCLRSTRRSCLPARSAAVATRLVTRGCYGSVTFAVAGTTTVAVKFWLDYAHLHTPVTHTRTVYTLRYPHYMDSTFCVLYLLPLPRSTHWFACRVVTFGWFTTRTCCTIHTLRFLPHHRIYATPHWLRISFHTRLRTHLSYAHTRHRCTYYGSYLHSHCPFTGSTRLPLHTRFCTALCVHVGLRFTARFVTRARLRFTTFGLFGSHPLAHARVYTARLPPLRSRCTPPTFTGLRYVLHYHTRLPHSLPPRLYVPFTVPTPLPVGCGYTRGSHTRTRHARFTTRRLFTFICCLHIWLRFAVNAVAPHTHTLPFAVILITHTAHTHYPILRCILRFSSTLQFRFTALHARGSRSRTLVAHFAVLPLLRLPAGFGSHTLVTHALPRRRTAPLPGCHRAARGSALPFCPVTIPHGSPYRIRSGYFRAARTHACRAFTFTCSAVTYRLFYPHVLHGCLPIFCTTVHRCCSVPFGSADLYR